MAILKGIFGSENDRIIKKWQPLVKKINELEPSMQELALTDFAIRTNALKSKIAEGGKLDDLLPEAFALVREAAHRTRNERHYDVQLIGGIALHMNNIAEMRTGEGKTLVATSPAYLNALTGKGVHIVTVNDYLSRRDAVWMAPIYALLGLSVGVVNSLNTSYIYDPSHQDKEGLESDDISAFKVQYEFLRPCSRAEAYACDITYGTNNEFGFDFLRDNLANSVGDIVQRGHSYAIVDEVDSILIDESRTPLIISAPSRDAENLYQVFAGIAAQLKAEEDYTIDEKLKAVQITDAGIDKAEKLLGVDNIYTDKGVKYVHHLETALRARVFYERDKDYIIKDGEVMIVDEFTGRLQPGRRWSEGLHQAIEAKEGVAIKDESRTFATVSYQNYFRLYKKLGGMTGTALTSSEEFLKVYGLDTVAVPPNRENKRQDLDDYIFQTEAGKFRALARRIKELNDEGKPVLVGTISIERNELLSALLRKEGVKHEILNAKNHEREGEIIAQAGRPGAVTIATNMAGRGVDIILGGNPPVADLQEKVRGVSGLHVLGTERHEARRIDNQLRGRAGRQGDPGVTQFFVSLEDSLMRIFASDSIKNMMGRFGLPEDEPIQNRLVSRALESAQAKIEGLNFDARKHLLEYDDVMNQQRVSVYGRRRAILEGNSEAIEAFLAGIVNGREDQEEIEKRIADLRVELGDEQFFVRVRAIVLQIIDMLWVEHLETMDYMRSSVRLRAYGQRDPLIEYKREGLNLFRQFEISLTENVLKLLPTLSSIAPTIKVETPKLQEVHESARLIGGDSGNAEEKPIVFGGAGHIDAAGRNDPCPCGSGRKYKNCGLQNTEEHQKNSGK